MRLTPGPESVDEKEENDWVAGDDLGRPSTAAKLESLKKSWLEKKEGKGVDGNPSPGKGLNPGAKGSNPGANGSCRFTPLDL